METIQSVASDSALGNGDSSNGGKGKKIYRTLYDVQGHLIRLYTGDYKMFSDLTCPNCSCLAIEPQDCPSCGEQICKPCVMGFSGKSTDRSCGNCNQAFNSEFKNAGKAVQGLLRNATFSCVYECGKMYLPLHRIEDHLEECRERLIECQKPDCNKVIRKTEQERHDEDFHPVLTVKSCEVCHASYFEKDSMMHSCIGYVLDLLKQVVGESSFDQAVKKLNAKYDINSQMSSQQDSSQNVTHAGSGTLESLLANQIQVFEKSMHKHLKSFMDRTEKAEESFLDRLDIAGRHRLGSVDFNSTDSKNGSVRKNNTHQQLPQTINLPDLPLVRVQDRRGFDSTNSSIEAPQSTGYDRHSNTFEKRRWTHAANTNRNLLDNNATDQKIPSIIRPIPDEMEEINLKGSVSMSSAMDKDEDKGVRASDRILVQHSGEKKNLKDRLKKSLEADLKPAERDLAVKLQSQIKGRQKSRLRQHSRGSTICSAQEAKRDQISHHSSKAQLLSPKEGGDITPSSFQQLISPASTKKSLRDEEKFRRTMHQTMSPSLNQSFYEESVCGSIRKLPLCGEKDANKPGYSIFEWHSKTTLATAAARRSLSTIQYWVGGSICAMRLIMTDGSRSPKFGKFHPLDKQVQLAHNDQVKYIEMRGDNEFVQSIKLYDKDTAPIVEIEGTFVEGETSTYELGEEEKIIGIYGIYNYQPYVVGLGFILWTPKPAYDTDNT